jgi:hypothetical protein
MMLTNKRDDGDVSQYRREGRADGGREETRGEERKVSQSKERGAESGK